MTVFGRISGHLFAAREMALKHDSSSTWERLMIEAFLIVNDSLLLFTRRVHHRLALGPGYPSVEDSC